MSIKKEKISFGKKQGARLRAAKEYLGLSTDEASSFAEVSAQQWRKYERGDAEPKVSRMLFMVQKGISLEWLIVGKGEMLAVDKAQATTNEDCLGGNLAEWVKEEYQKNPNFFANFTAECAAYFPDFAEWIKKRKGSVTQDTTARRKVS